MLNANILWLFWGKFYLGDCKTAFPWSCGFLGREPHGEHMYLESSIGAHLTGWSLRIWYGWQEDYSGPWLGSNCDIPSICIYIYIILYIYILLYTFFYPSITCIYIWLYMYISLSQFSTHSVQSDLNFQLLHLRPCWKTPSPTKSGSISSCTLRRSGRRRNSFSRPSRWEQMWRWALKATVDLVGPSAFLFKKCGLDLQLMCCWLFFLFRSTPILLQCS